MKAASLETLTNVTIVRISLNAFLLMFIICVGPATYVDLSPNDINFIGGPVQYTILVAPIFHCPVSTLCFYMWGGEGRGWNGFWFWGKGFLWGCDYTLNNLYLYFIGIKLWEIVAIIHITQMHCKSSTIFAFCCIFFIIQYFLRKETKNCRLIRNSTSLQTIIISDHLFYYNVHICCFLFQFNCFVVFLCLFSCAMLDVIGSC